MGYPPQYMPKFDMAQAAANGDLPSAVEISTELYNAATSINQCVSFLRAAMTADQKWKPAQIQASTFVIVDRQEAAAGQTVFLYANSVTIDPSVATVSVFVDGALLDPELYTTEAAQVTLDTGLAAGTVIIMEIRENAASLLSDLGSTVANLGASLIGINDVDGRYSAADVEGALSEVRQAFDAFVLLVGDLSEYLKADGSVVWTGDQDAGGNRLTDLAPGIDPGDAVIVSQLQVILAQFVDLGGRFLPLTGGAMSGPINMNGQPLVGLPAPAVASAAVRLTDLTTGIATAGDPFIPTRGTADPTRAAQATVTGPLNFGGLADGSTVADADQTTDPSAVVVPTMHGVPRGAAPDHLVNKAQFDDTLDGDDTVEVQTRLQCREAGDCALASEDGVVGHVLVVSGDDSPDGKGKLLRPINVPALVAGAHATGFGEGSVTVTITTTGTWIAHVIAYKRDDGDPGTDYAASYGHCVVVDGVITHQARGGINTNGSGGWTTASWSIAGDTLSNSGLNGDIQSESSIVAHRIA